MIDKTLFVISQEKKKWIAQSYVKIMNGEMVVKFPAYLTPELGQL